MVISTKGRYALRLMIDLAQHCDEGFISLKTVSQRQDVSLKYMEAIAAALNRANLVISQRGKEGGYRLSRPASDITVAEGLHSTEGILWAGRPGTQPANTPFSSLIKSGVVPQQPPAANRCRSR